MFLLCDQTFVHQSPIDPFMAKFFRPGQFGVFTVVKPDFDINATITRALPTLAKLNLKGVEWIDLGGGILAVLFSSFRAQIFLYEWQVIFSCVFENTNTDVQQRNNSKRVVKILADARHNDAMNINFFTVR